jgi:transcriptional regulator with XRE-family HTH domain
MPRARRPPLGTRIRRRRTRLGLTRPQLARRAGIPPAQLSLIEKGSEVPDEDAALRLARALDDDPAVYRAWVLEHRAADGPGSAAEWKDAAELASRLRQVAARSPALGRLLRGAQGPLGRPDDPRHAFAFVNTAAERRSDPTFRTDGAPDEGDDAEASEAADIIRVHVLADGADPGRPLPSPLAIRDRLLVDRRLVGDHEPERLFAYEVGLHHMAHLRGLASPGDRIVFRRGGRVTADRICAVRTLRGIVLARVLFKGRSLLLLPGEGEQDFASVDVEGVKALPGVIAGTHVLLMRR